MTDRNDRLGELYDQACEYLAGSFDDADNMGTDVHNYCLGIIDRYLSQQNADRQYALAERLQGLGICAVVEYNRACTRPKGHAGWHRENDRP